MIKNALLFSFFCLFSLVGKASDHSEASAHHEETAHAEGQSHGAVESKESSRVEQPDSCFPSKKPCAVRFLEQTKVEIDGEEIHVMAGSSILFHAYREWQIVEGGLWAPKLVGAEIRFGETRFFAAGGVYFRRQKTEMIARNLDGQLRVRYPNQAEKELPAGFENRFGVIGEGLKLDEGMVKAVDAKAFVTDWLKTAVLTQADRDLYFASYRRIRGFAVVEAGLMYKQAFVMRETAALEKKQSEEAAVAKKKKDQDTYRKLFRDRFFEPPELRGSTLD